MSQKSKKHFWGDPKEQKPVVYEEFETGISDLEEKEKVKPEKTSNKEVPEISFKSDKVKTKDMYETTMSTPLYVCDQLNNSSRVLRILLRGQPVSILSENSAPWFQVETTDGPYIKGFVLSMFLKKVKVKDKDD